MSLSMCPIWYNVSVYVSYLLSLMSKLTGQSSLLSELWVITIKIGSFFIGEHNMQVREETEHDHSVAEHHMHPRYDAKTSQYNHDIALLKLLMPAVLSDYSLPICLGPKDFTETVLREASSSVVSGWGRMRFQGPEASILQKVEVPYVDRTECKGSSAEQVSRFMFCAGYHSEQKDSCNGDSGGPHATRYRDTWFLTGIVSWGEECAKEGKYGIYTRVSRYFRWISNVTGFGGIGFYSETDV
ncbi:coagulation factor IX-like [Coregonus clupeaformis]|uniref:coagulation factor IX-like n=1 Tax=Coregonus clupeaformis TaxID=59861 RepID=UPI001E1C9B03|nr:coagulation factor IX-like [Coregonus clupeaformis]